MKLGALGLFPLVFLFSGAAPGEGLPKLSPELIAIATGAAVETQVAPASVTVITRDDIEALGAFTLDEAIETVPGAHVSLSSFHLNPVYIFRGIFSDKNPHVLVMLDGVPLNQLFLGNWGQRPEMPLENVERIEVIRGPGSALYGADAVAGVVNIITRPAGSVPKLASGGRLDGKGKGRAWLIGGRSAPSWAASVFLAYSDLPRDDERVVRMDAQSLIDALSGTHASRAPGPLDTRQKRLDVHLDFSSGGFRAHLFGARQMDAGLGMTATLALDPDGRADAETWLGFLEYKRTVGAWTLKGRLSRYGVSTDVFEHLFPPGALLPLGPDGNVVFDNPLGFVLFPEGMIGKSGVSERKTRAEAMVFYRGFKKHVIHAGLGWEKGNLWSREKKNFGPGILTPPFPSQVGGELSDTTDTDFVFLPDNQRILRFAYVQDQWSVFPDFELLAGVRHDEYSDFGGTTNPRVGLVWQTSYRLVTRLLYNEAFRAPSFAELYTRNNPAALGNPSLDPEKLRMFELGFVYSALGGRIGLSLYRYTLDDLVEFVPLGEGPESMARNVGKRIGKGFEVEARARLHERLGFTGNYAYQIVEDGRTGREAAGVPRHLAHMRFDWKMGGGWTLSPSFNWVGDRPRA
ncbi:MAG: TonB-dependent receptor, partial [Gammaproteobacteria bacterium]